MGEPHRKPATFDDLQALPEHVFAEIASGELIVTPRPRPRHGRASRSIIHRVGGPFDMDGDPGGWWILGEPAVRLEPGEIVCPDLAGWRRARVPELPDELPLSLAPDWVCEVLSPSTSLRDRTRKADLYLTHGVGHYWLVDTEPGVLEALEARDGRWIRLGAWSAADKVRIAPFDAIELDVGALFR